MSILSFHLEKCSSLKSSYNRDKRGGIKLRPIHFRQAKRHRFCSAVLPTSALKAPSSLEDKWAIFT